MDHARQEPLISPVSKAEPTQGSSLQDASQFVSEASPTLTGQGQPPDVPTVAGSPFSIAPAASDTRRLQLEFTADGNEYFRIWVVNVFLSVITLGIYSAWAKVRRVQYFYAHTRLDGAPFEYLASPAKILKGRLFVVGTLAILITVANFYPNFLLLGILVFIPFFPGLINKALIFKTRNTAYRNIRFNFTGTYRRSLWVFVVLFVLSASGWLYPLFHHRRKRYLYNT